MPDFSKQVDKPLGASATGGAVATAPPPPPSGTTLAPIASGATSGAPLPTSVVTGTAAAVGSTAAPAGTTAAPVGTTVAAGTTGAAAIPQTTAAPLVAGKETKSSSGPYLRRV